MGNTRRRVQEEVKDDDAADVCAHFVHGNVGYADITAEVWLNRAGGLWAHPGLLTGTSPSDSRRDVFSNSTTYSISERTTSEEG